MKVVWEEGKWIAGRCKFRKRRCLKAWDIRVRCLGKERSIEERAVDRGGSGFLPSSSVARDVLEEVAGASSGGFGVAMMPVLLGAEAPSSSLRRNSSTNNGN